MPLQVTQKGKSRQKGFILTNSVFSLGKPVKNFQPAKESGRFFENGKLVTREYFEMAADTGDRTAKSIKLTGYYSAEICISDKISKITSTIAFYPKGNNDSPIYLFISEVLEGEKTGEVTYITKSGRNTMGTHHIKVFEQN